jgi:hypothetical protein
MYRCWLCVLRNARRLPAYPMVAAESPRALIERVKSKFQGTGRFTGNQEVAQKRRHFRVGDNRVP